MTVLCLDFHQKAQEVELINGKQDFIILAKISDTIILPLGIDYPSKTFTLEKVFNPTGENEKDIIALKFILKNYIGRHPSRQ